MEKAFSIQIDKFVSSEPKKIAVAISGGADSFALLHLARYHAKTDIIALTVDHQLRPESAAEAQQVMQWCQQNGIEHHILKWIGDKPSSALQANARNARRRLLCDFCQQHGIEFLLLGHQADDQAETMLMRLQRGTGLKGLKAMQPVTRDKATNTAILRPLLNFRRAELRDYCIENNLPFIDDPSNDNPVYERVRIRNLLASLPELAVGIAKSTPRLRRADKTLEQLAKHWVENHALFLETEIWLPQACTTLLPEMQLRVLGIVCRQLLRLPQLEKLAQEIGKPDFAGITFGQWWIKPKVLDKNLGFLFKKAPPRLSGQP
jgi:tRNA(Ile)-lysidine synthase